MIAVRWRRLAPVLVLVLVVGLLVAAPSAAYATKAVTRIVAAKTVTVNRDTPGIDPWPRSLSVRLQKRITSSHYHALTGTVKLYRYDPVSRTYVYQSSKRGSTMTFSLAGRGKYRLYYAGTSTTRSSSAYTGVYESVGISISDATVSIVPIDADHSWLNVSYDIDWNTEAVSNVALVHSNQFWNGDMDMPIYGAWLYFEHDCGEPGTVEFSHKIHNTDIMSTLWLGKGSFVEWQLRGEYVITPDWVDTDVTVGP